MPLINETYESLPYIDAEPTAAQRTHAQSLISAELSPEATSSPSHPLLPDLATSNLSEAMTLEHARIAASKPLRAIDLARYEALDAPATKDITAWQDALAKAYTSHVYLSGRTKTLETLNVEGKDEWLAGNEELVVMLTGLEKELAKRQEEIDRVVVDRQRAQEAVGAELEGLETTWREGVGRVLETEVAAEQLRGEILERRRQGAL